MGTMGTIGMGYNMGTNFTPGTYSKLLICGFGIVGSSV